MEFGFLTTCGEDCTRSEVPKKALSLVSSYETEENADMASIHMAACRVGSVYLLNPIIAKGIG